MEKSKFDKKVFAKIKEGLGEAGDIRHFLNKSSKEGVFRWQVENSLRRLKRAGKIEFGQGRKWRVTSLAQRAARIEKSAVEVFAPDFVEVTLKGAQGSGKTRALDVLRAVGWTVSEEKPLEGNAGVSVIVKAPTAETLALVRSRLEGPISTLLDTFLCVVTKVIPAVDAYGLNPLKDPDMAEVEKGTNFGNLVDALQELREVSGQAQSMPTFTRPTEAVSKLAEDKLKETVINVPAAIVLSPGAAPHVIETGRTSFADCGNLVPPRPFSVSEGEV